MSNASIRRQFSAPIDQVLGAYLETELHGLDELNLRIRCYNIAYIICLENAINILI